MNDDQEVLDLLKDGDERIRPSMMIAQKSSVSSVVTQSIPSEVPPDSSEEGIMAEVEGNLRVVIDYGSNAIKELSDLASSSEHPRPYEALSTLIKSVTDANMSLLSIRKKDKKVAADRFEPKEDDPKTNTISASVADLLDEMDRKKKAAAEAIDVDFEQIE